MYLKLIYLISTDFMKSVMLCCHWYLLAMLFNSVVSRAWMFVVSYCQSTEHHLTNKVSADHFEHLYR
jgi:hypothetical protein